MLVHLGQDRLVGLRRIEAILDYNLFVRLPANRWFLELARSAGRVDGDRSRPPAAVVLTDERVYLCPVSRFTLARRAARAPGGPARRRQAVGRGRRPP